MPERPFVRTFNSIVYPMQCDAMGHMTVQFYVAAVDQAMWTLVYHLGWRPVPDAKSRGFADVEHVIRYRAELLVGAPYFIESRATTCGRSSLITEHRMVDLVSGALAAEFTLTSVHFDLVNRKSIPFDDDFRDGIMT